jgi:hypothetical protein
MNRHGAAWLGAGLALAGAWAVGHSMRATGADAGASIAAMLDDFHDAAAKADEARYFDHFAPGAVFLGTDPRERWTLEEFRAYAEPHFEAGRGWAYQAVSRHVEVGPGGEVGWFDEVVRNAKYGDLRGTGVALRIDGRWRVAQYSLTFTIPNEDVPDVLKIVRRRGR